MNKYTVEYTDTFGGEANYSWVKRASLTEQMRCDGAKELRACEARIRRKAKAAVGLSGVRGQWCDIGDVMEFRPYGMCTVLFVMPE